MSTLKKLVSWILIMVLTFSVIPFGDFAALAEDIENAVTIQEKTPLRTSGNWTYSIMKYGIASIEGYSGDATSLKIPDEIDGYPVGAIGDNALASQIRLTSVTIPTQVFSIGEGAFYNPAILTVTGYDGSEGLEWAKENGAKVKSLTDMYLNSGIVDLSGVGSAAKKTSESTLEVNSALATVLKKGTTFFFTATDKYGQNYWGGEVTNVVRHENGATLNYKTVEAKVLIDKIIASSDMEEIRMEFIPAPNLMVETENGMVEASKVDWELHFLGDIWGKVYGGNGSNPKKLIDKNIKLGSLPIHILSTFTYDFSVYYDPNLFSKDVLTADMNFEINTTITGHGDWHVDNGKKGQELGEVILYGVKGFGLSIPLDFFASADGSIDINIRDVVSLNWNYDSRKNKSVPKPVFTHNTPVSSVVATGHVRAGLGVGLTLKLFDERIVYIGVEGGVHGIGIATIHSLLVDRMCVDLELRLYGKVNVYCMFIGSKSFGPWEKTIWRNHYEFDSIVPLKVNTVSRCTREPKKIKFALNGGEPMNVFNDKTVEWGSTFSIGAPTRRKYDFKGWYTDAAFKNKWVNESRVYNDMTLYAKWERSYEPVSSVSINKSSMTIHSSGADRTGQLSVTVLPTDATNKTIKWSSSNNSVATVNSNGLVTGIAKGQATITGVSADNANKKVTCVVTVKQYVNQIKVSAANTTPLRLGTTQVSAVVLPENANDKSYTWSSSNTNIATVDNAGTVTAKKVGTVVITATAKDGSGVTGSVTINVKPIPVSSVTVNNKTAVVYTSGEGKTTQLTASILPTNADDQSVTWESDRPGIAGVDANGKVTGMSAGTAVITVRSHFNPSIFDQCTVTVKQLVTRLTLNENDISLDNGQTAQLNVNVVPVDATDKSVRWVSSNPRIATVSDTGLVTATGGGNVVISAVANDGSLVMAQCIVHVSGQESEPVIPDPSVSVQSIVLDFDAIRVFTRGISHSIQLHAYVTPENAGNPDVIWSSSDTAIATVDSTGMVTGIKGGIAVITARSAENESIKATCSVTVEQLAESIVLNKTSASILKGEETVLLTGVVLPETATNRTIKWVSSDTNKAVVDYTGLVNGVGLGDVVITAEATDGSGVTAEFNLTVLPVPVRSVSLNTTSATAYTIGRDHEIQLTAEALPVHAEDRSLNWSSSDPAVANVDENGKVTGIAQGTAIITVQSVSNPEKKATCTVTVKTWVEDIEIHAERKVMEPNEQLQISATVSPEDATDRTVTWSSSNPNVITVNANGQLHAHAIGNAVITVKANDGSEVTDTINFSVKENPVYEVRLGETAIVVETRGENRAHQLSWQVLPEKATDKTVSWFSSDNEVAYVDDMGRVIGVSGGTAVITVRSDSNPEITAQCTVTVNQKVETIFVTTEKAALINGETVQMQVEVGPASASNTGVTWTTSNSNVATVDQNGLVNTVGVGKAVISATAQDGSNVSDSVEISVEKWMNLSGSIADTTYYLKGNTGVLLGDVMITRPTIERIIKENKTAIWTLSGGGEHSKVGLKQKNVVYQANGEEIEIPYASVTIDKLMSDGTDTYTLTCTAGDHSESITFSVTCDGSDYAEQASVGFNDIMISIDEPITIPAVPNAIGDGALPEGLALNLSGDIENAQITEDQNGKNISFSASSVYTVTAEYSAGNLIYSVPVTIRVKGEDGLVKLPVKEVVMSAGSVSMVLDEMLKLEAAGFYGSEELDCTFEWSSSNETVATVNSDGEVTACGIGTAVIYAYAENGTAYGWCTVRVENVLDFIENDIEVTVYAGGDDNVELANVLITNASVSRLDAMNLVPDWKIEKLYGNSAELAVQELDFSAERDAAAVGALVSLIRIYDEGDTSFKLICSADDYQAELPITIHVIRPEKALPESIQLSNNSSYAAVVDEPIRINTALVINPTTAELPDDAEMYLNAAGAFGKAVISSSFEEGYLELVFGKSGTYTGELEIRGTNYTYAVPFTVAVADENGVVAKMPEEVLVSPGYQFLMVGETVQMSAEVLPEDADNKSVIWSSYDETVATVSDNGLVTAVSAGSAVIHAASADADVYGDSTVYVEDSLSMAKASDSINVYLDGLTRTVLDTYYLSYASSARFAGKTPAWTLNRVSGSNLTLKAMPTEELATDGIVRLGAVVSLHSVTRPGTTVYDLTCTIDGESTTMRLTVKALERGNSLPDSLSLDQTDYYATVGELIVFEPEISSIPSDKPVPADLRVSFELDDNAKAVVNENDYFVSRARSTFSFKRAGTYYANAVYACGNVNYTIPVTFHIADQDGNVPVFVNKLTADPKELFLEKGDTARIQAVISPLNATDQDVTYISVNPDIATVSLDGTVTAVTEGYTQILITPSDDHVNATVCNVTVEKGFNVISAATSAILYLQGAQSQNLSSFMLTEGTMQRLAARGLTPEWTVTRKSGNAATYGVLISEDNRQLTLVTEALRQGGTDVYSITCTAGTNTWKEDFTLQVTDLADTLPESVAVQDSEVTMEVGEMRTIRFAPEYAPANATLPDALRTSYIYSGLGNFYDAVNYDVYKENGDEVEVAFTKPGTYLLSRTWYHLNLQYSALCIITVTGDGQTAGRPLMKLSDTEYTVYAGGKSAVTVTADIYDAFAYEAFADRISWSLERISGDSVTASLVNNGRHVGVYVANVKKEGNDVWRLTCRIGDYSESADITIHAIVPRTNLPDSISLPEDTFTAMAGEYIYLPFDVTSQPAGTRLPDTGKDFWRLEMRDTEDQDLIETVLSDTGIKVRFREVGSYSGILIYESGNAKYEVPVYFYITDEAGEVTDDNLKLAGSYLVDKVWMDGLMGVGIGRITLVDGDNGVASGAGAALVKKAGAEWSITVTSGGSCGRLAIAETDPGQAQVMLVSASIAGTVEYRVTCTVAGKTYTYDDAIEVVSASTPKPALNMTHTTYTLAVGETVVIDRRILFADTGAKFASASAENWNNAGAIAAMGYGFEANGDTWVTTFYEEGTFRTTVDIMVGNLAYSLPINFKVLSPGETVKQTVLRMPSMLLEIEDEAMLGVKANVIDMRNSNITTIGRKAFGGNNNLETAYLPASIRSIADDAFDGSNYVIIVCPKGSYADTWATKHGIAVEYEQNN